MDYIIGSGAILEAGPSGGITPASFHAHVGLPAQAVHAAAVDFEGTTSDRVQKLLVVIQGGDAAAAREQIERPLRARGECSLADVLATLALAARTNTVHVFAHWLPDEATCAALAGHGIDVVAHPLETVQAASIVSGQRYRRVA